MNFHVYIIYSVSLDKYYVGETENFEIRLKQHNSGFFETSFTKQANDWSEYLLIRCNDRIEARKVEQFIKKMKSRKFIERLKHNAALVDSILQKLQAAGHSPDASGRTL